MRRVGINDSREISLKDAGVRRDFYRRERPSGEAIYDVEWSLAQGEDAALPVLAQIGSRWPLSTDDKGKLGQFFAAQHVRVPAFRAWHERFVEGIAEELLGKDPRTYTTPPEGMSPEEARDKYIEHLRSGTYRSLRMLNLVRSVGTVLASMHWTLVAIGKPIVMTSDHAVVIWPLSRVRARPVANNLDGGVQDTLEVFVPLSPTSILLMSWLYDEDAPARVDGQGRHAATVNAFVAANGDKQLFHKPGIDPWIPTGPRQPLSPKLVPGYGARAATASPRRQSAINAARNILDSPVDAGTAAIVTVTRR